MTDNIHFLRQAELARRWEFSARTLERWRWLGKGPRYMRIGKRVRYRLEDIEAYEAALMMLTSEKGSNE